MKFEDRASENSFYLHVLKMFNFVYVPFRLIVIFVSEGKYKGVSQMQSRFPEQLFEKQKQTAIANHKKINI